MIQNLNIYLLNEKSNLINETIIVKPKTYEGLLNSLKSNIPNLPESFKIFFHKNNNKIFINNNADYKLIKNDLIYVVENNNNNINNEESLFSINYNQLSKSKKEIYDNKYNCPICLTHIKNENPYFCYKCQKIYHTNCLNDWDKKRGSPDQILKCPSCNNALPLKEWKKKLDHEENRKNDENILNELNRLNNLHNNYNIKGENENKMKELRYEIIKIKEEYNNYIKLTSKILRNIFIKIDEINKLINHPINYNLKRIIDSNQIITLNNNINNLFIQEIEKIKKYIINLNNNNYFIPSTQIYENQYLVDYNNYEYQTIIESNRNEINLVYNSKYETQ